VPRHVARLVTRLVAPLVVDFSASPRLVVDFSASLRLVVDFSASRTLVVDNVAYAARLGASVHRAAHRSLSTTPPRAGSSSTGSPPPRIRVPRHVARLVTQLVAPLVVDFTASPRLVVDFSASPRLVVDFSASRTLVVDYFAYAARPGASACRAARHAARRRLL
jgi:hypothetical protein